MPNLVRLLAFCFAVIPLTEGLSCDAPSVQAGQSVNISCYFNEDVRVNKKNIKVQKTPPGTTTFDPDVVQTVAECFWADAETFKCDVQDGYELHGKITDRATLGIPRSSKTFEGRYMCETVPSDPSDIKACELHVYEGPDNININLSVTDPRPLDIAILAISTLTLIGLIVVVIVFQKDRFRMCLQRCRTKKTAGKGEEIPMDDVKTISNTELMQMLEASVKSALLDASHTNTGVLLIGTMSEIQRRLQTGKLQRESTENPLSTASKANTATTAPKTSSPDAEDDHTYDKLQNLRDQAQVRADPKNQDKSEGQQTKESVQRAEANEPLVRKQGGGTPRGDPRARNQGKECVLQ